jgi:hypothetical protein
LAIEGRRDAKSGDCFDVGGVHGHLQVRRGMLVHGESASDPEPSKGATGLGTRRLTLACQWDDQERRAEGAAGEGTERILILCTV